MKWSIEVNNTLEGFPCLQRTFYTKFWSKLLQKNPKGKLHGHEIIDLINVKISKYYDTSTLEPQVMEDLSPFKKITRKLQMKKGLISNHTNEEFDTCIVGEGQDVNEEEIDIETILIRYQQQIEESSSTSTTGKGKEKVVKTTEETITIDSDNQTFRLLFDNDLAP
ncbi:hypothetical protein H5410_004390 [Solanum commersonii]|uniref:Uncharacterized protein n=1 Tax=Solanum commersonii TaxID=4109 RepID=A0A9J6B7M5_SOLCO|nr:hypothetical protein H5410_004390 [Solanum commersonii]